MRLLANSGLDVYAHNIETVRAAVEMPEAQLERDRAVVTGCWCKQSAGGKQGLSLRCLAASITSLTGIARRMQDPVYSSQLELSPQLDKPAA